MTKGPTFRSLQRATADRLSAVGIDSARLDARILVGYASDLDREALFVYADRPVPNAVLDRLESLVAQRLDRQPVSRIVGRREFWSLDFILSPDTLDPRPDSETVVEAALAQKLPPHPAILDLGTGSGCLLLALLSELPQAHGLGLDVSPGAVAAATLNAARLALSTRARFEQHDWRRGLAGQLTPQRFDLIVANPPYIPDGDIPSLEPEVARHEPYAALAGGPDGLAAYRGLAPQLGGLLTTGGVAVFEVGAGQAASVAALFCAANLDVVDTRADLGGIERCVIVHGRR